MKAALLVSDIFGSGGDTRYLLDWRQWLSARGFAVKEIMLDELLPNIYPFGKYMTLAAMHACVSQPAVCVQAITALRRRIDFHLPELLMGFSFGGYLAFGARASMPLGASLICISAT